MYKRQAIDRLTDRNEKLQTSIEDLTDTIKASKGTKSVEAYRDQHTAGYHRSHLHPVCF